jgi:aminopeptidase N
VTSNLTRSEARERARLLNVQSYQVELDLTGDELTFGSVCTVRFGCATPGAATFIDLTASAVRAATLNGTRLRDTAFDGHRLTLEHLAADNELRIEADCAYTRSSEGLHRFTDPADGRVYLYTDLEPYEAHQVYACFDQPDLKATFDFAVTVPDEWLAVSNMPVAGDPEPAAGGGATWRFEPTPALSSYITAVAAGPYHEVRGEHDGIPMGVYCRQSLAEFLDPEEILETTAQGFDFFHREFGVRYPFAKYDQLFVPEFKAGAMENAGCVTLLERYVYRSRVTEAAREARASTILHELAHMWFGDLVTMRWWDDLWLNESFATWASTVAQAEATRWRDAWTTFAELEKSWAQRQDQLPSTHPIAADIPDVAAVEVNFDGITYGKGAAVLKQLVAYVGRDNFATGVRAYFDAHAWGNATLGDLLGALEQTSGRDLAAWSKAWLETAGVNTLRPSYETGPDGAITSFSVLQEAPASHPVLRPHRIAIGLYELADGRLRQVRQVEADIAGEATAIPALVGQPRPDLVLVNDDDLTYAKVRLDTRSMRTLIAAAGRFEHSLPAAVCWAGAWDMVRDAELPARDYLNLVRSGAGAITDVALLQTVLGQAASAVRLFADPRWRPTGLRALAACVREQLQQAEPGSDAQLSYAVALTGLATDEADLELFRALLDGTASIEGLVIDTDMRWRLLHRLVSQGAAGHAQIDRERAADPTDAGERQAAGAAAAIPRPDAKAEAWRQITGGALPSAVFRSVLRGFTDPDQDALLAPFAKPFFDEVTRIWSDWGSDMAMFFAEEAYPSTLVSQEAIDVADDFLARPGLPPGLHRLLAEGRDGVARQLRCRQRDAAAAAQAQA